MAAKPSNTLIAYGVQSDQLLPNENRQSIPYTIAAADTAAAFDITFDFTLLQNGVNFSAVRTMFVDNSKNPSPITVNVSGSGQQFPVPPYTAGYFNVSSSSVAKTIELISVGGATGTVYVEFFNYTIAPDVWAGFAPFVPGVQVVTKPDVGTPVVRSAVLAATTPANIFPAVATATQKWFRNVGANAAFYNVNVGATGTFVNGDKIIQPGEAVLLPFSYKSAVSFWSELGTSIEALEF